MRRLLRHRIAGLLMTWMLLLLAAACVRADDIGRIVETQYGLYPDMATNIRVQYIGSRVALAAGLTSTSFKVFNDAELNAMALPDGRVFVTSKMAAVVSDDELAFVIGHELTHVKEKHGKHQQERATGGAILGAILVGLLGGSDEAIRMGADIAGGLAYGQYSQKDEYKADRGGIQLMSQCGYDPRKAADAMQRLLDLYGRGDAKTPVLGWFASHPDTKNRKQRLLDTAAELEKTPLTRIPEPTGVTLAFDQSAEHAASWAHAYFTLLTAANGAGRAVVLPDPRYPIRAMVRPAPETPDANGRQEKEEKDNEKKKDAPLPVVTFNCPQVPAGYRVTLALRQVPAGRAATIEAGAGTAVEATVHWTQIATGFSGDCTAIHQTRSTVPWQAQEQLKDENKLYELSSGRAYNVEGTLEARAIRRAAMAFAEVLEANAPVDHSAPVTIRMKTDGLRPGDYVYVTRGNLIVAEVCVNQIINKKELAGSVLWGTHTWKKKDRFVPANE